MWARWIRRLRLQWQLQREEKAVARKAIPDLLWRRTLKRFAFLPREGTAEELALRRMTSLFLDRKEFTGAHGLVVTDDMAVAIAAQACLPVLGLGLSAYDGFVGIVVHPGLARVRREYEDEDGIVHEFEETLSGEAVQGGPVMLSWRDVRSAGAKASQAYNVVIHEFAHKLDQRDGQSDGCPPLPSRAARRAWLELMEREYEAFREKVIVAERFGGEPTWLDPYGAQSIDEFFPVACEAYFVNRERFALEFPALVPLFDAFFLPA